MKIYKADLVTEGNKVTFSMPMTKVDKENRLVQGWATLDNYDTQKDRVIAEANKRAFSRFRGNIREMHQPIAVGKMLDFREDRFYNEDDGQWYDGIFVDVYVSKGAESTWEKVLDGTLTGFSIGGNIIDFENVIDKAVGGSVRVVKDYELVELSLVDSPANQLANIISIHKTATGTFVDGTVADMKSESVFYCSEDGIAKTSNDDEVTCPNGHKMESIGWIEYESDDTKTEKVEEVVTKHNSSHENAKQEELPATTEGGVDVAEDKKEVEAGSSTTVVTEVGEQGKAQTEVAASVEETEHVHAEGDEHNEDDKEVEKAADVSEVQVEETDFAKMFGDLQTTLEAGLTKTREEVTSAVTKATESVEAVNLKVADLEKANTELNTKFDGLVEQLSAVSKAVETVDAGTAVKKSSDVGASAEDTLSKSQSSSKGWGGTFLPTSGKRFLSVSDIEGSN